MNHQLCAPHKFNKFLCDLTESRLASQKLPGDTVHLQRAGIDVPLRLDVLVIVATGDTPVDKLYAANLDNAMPLVNLEPGSFRVEYDLTSIHRSLSPRPCRG